jgi:hypothetical protein
MKDKHAAWHRDAATAICALTEPAMTCMKGTVFFADHHVVKILCDLFHTGLRIRPVRRTQRFPPLP